MKPNRILRLALAAAFFLAAMTLPAQDPQGGFSEASLTGSYAAREQGDGAVAVGLGVYLYDGAGRTTRTVRVNAPGEEGSRRILTFESEGIHTANPDGTGTATYTSVISTGQTARDTFDFVITGTQKRWVAQRG